MIPPALSLRLLGALVLVILLLADHHWRGQPLGQVLLWAWGALALAVIILLTQWPQQSKLSMLRRVPLGWRVGMTMGLSIKSRHS